jgi:hypothetical protein
LTSFKATRAIIQAFYGDKPVHSVPERCSIKVPGCPEWVAHLDRSREGSYQVVIALTATSFLVWPDSHRVAIARDKSGFHALLPDELEVLEQAGCRPQAVPASAGDVLVMLGGLLVHSSPRVQVQDGARIATYANWAVDGS